MEKPDDKIMNNKPREKKEGFFANGLVYAIVLEGLMIGLLTLASYIIGEKVFGNHIIGQTMAFLTLSGCQLFHAFNVKSDKSIFSKTTFNNKMLNLAFILGFVLQFAVMYIPGLHDTVFGLASLTLSQVGIALGLSFSTVIVMEIIKLFKNKKNK